MDTCGMTDSRYAFVTLWSFDAPIEAVWDEIHHPLDYPQWWRGILSVEQLAAGDAEGLHSRYRFAMRSRLPYTLRFDTEMTRVERPTVMQASSSGELVGVGLWTLTRTATGTDVRYDWTVEVTKPWMRALSPVARTIFEWNHNAIMAGGFEGLRTRLTSRAASR
jgi:uncharacterized protein YndB with AHSA1/START domain